jgi:hypothetical protein
VKEISHFNFPAQGLQEIDTKTGEAYGYPFYASYCEQVMQKVEVPSYTVYFYTQSKTLLGL